MASKKIVNKHFGIVAEKLSNASPSRPACAECSLHEGADVPFLKPFIPEHWTGEYLFVFETSQLGEESYRRNGVPLSPRESINLGRVLRRADIDKGECAFVPVLRCRPHLTGSKKPKMVHLRACRPFLLRAIDELKPKHIIACGESAVKSLMNTGAPGPQSLLRGRELKMFLVTEVNSTHPIHSTVRLSALLVDPHSHNRMFEDLRKLKLPLTKYPEKGIPNGKNVAGKGRYIGFDTEYGTKGEVFTLGIADSARGIAVSPKNASAAFYQSLASATVVGHNLPVDLESLIRIKPNAVIRKALEQWLQGGKQRDTLLEARLTDENRGKNGYKLESLACSLFNVKDWKGPTESIGVDSGKWPTQLREERCRLDAWATLKIHNALADELEGPSRLSHEIAMSLRRMYHAGVYIDKKAFDTFRAQVYKDRASSLKEVEKYGKQFEIEEFCATKDNYIREYVYGQHGVGLEVESFTKGGLPSVSVKHLKEYINEKPIQALISFSKADKLQSTYCDSLSKKFQRVAGGLWMPVQINPLAAKTGRRSSNAPNFQNWPVSVRKIIVSRFRKGIIADNDYSKLEPILGGWVTDEPRLTEYFVKYPNGYIKLGTDFFKKTVEKNTKEYTSMKACVLAILYNKKKWSLADDLWSNKVKLDQDYEKHIEESGRLLEKFLDMFPKVRDYHQQQEEEVLSAGKIYNALGQCRRLPLPDEPPRSEKGVYRAWMKHKSHVINQAINYPIQSLAAYVTGCGLVDLEEAFLSQWKLTYLEYQSALMEKNWPHMPLLCIEVHDDLVQDIPHGLEAKTKEITHDIMSKPPSLFEVLPELWDSNVKLSVDTNIAPCWGMKA